jgi:hypothetical protein
MSDQLVIDPVATRAYTDAHGDTAFTTTKMFDLMLAYLGNRD